LTTLAFIVFEWLKIIEPNTIMLYDPKILLKSVHSWTSAAMFPGRQFRNFAYPFQVADDETCNANGRSQNALLPH